MKRAERRETIDPTGKKRWERRATNREKIVQKNERREMQENTSQNTQRRAKRENGRENR